MDYLPKDIFLLKYTPSVEYPERPIAALPVNGPLDPDSAEYR